MPGDHATPPRTLRTLPHVPDIVVVGAGVSGLSCALTLLDAGHHVRVWADRAPMQTTSAVAAAVWYPLRGERDPRLDRWLPVSFERFSALARDERTGVRLRGGIELFRAPADDEWWRDVLPNYRRARTDELPPGFVDGFVADGVPVMEMPVYLQHLTGLLAARGVEIELRAVRSLDEPLADADVVVNCAGLGARELASDPSMQGVRGQVVWIEPVGLERYILDEQNPEGIAYVYPRATDVVCGGTRESDIASLEPDEATAEAILARCAALEPRIAGARVLAHRVGIRPGRPSVRLEPEEREGKLIVHDYGHGGSGVTLSWGCAAEVADLVADA